jgi:AraC-like DNA-binding protein
MLRRQADREWVPTGTIPMLAKALRLGRFPWHWHQHPELELTLITSGSGRRLVGDAVEDFVAGDCVLLGPDLPHTWISAGHAEPAQAFVLQFTTDLGGPAVRPLLQRLAQRAAGGLRLTGTLQQHVSIVLPELVRCRLPLDRLGRTLSLLALVCEAEPQALSPPWTANAPAADPVLGRVLEHVRHHLTDDLNQASCAAMAGLSPAAFARAFRRRLGTTFRDHVAGQRVALACRMLAATDEPIVRIAFSTGFGNLANFNRRFLQAMRMTPSTYRSRSR